MKERQTHKIGYEEPDKGGTEIKYIENKTDTLDVDLKCEYFYQLDSGSIFCLRLFFFKM